MSMYKREPDDTDLDGDPEDETRFECPCGVEGCVGYNDDPANIQVGKTWYAAGCKWGRMREQVMRGTWNAAMADEARDDA